MQERLNRLLKEEWYIQGCPARPFFIMSVSGMPAMKQGAGYCYHSLLALYRNDYGEWCYPVSDLEKYGKELLQILKQNPNFLEEKRALYDKQNRELEPIFLEAEQNMEKLDDSGLLDLLHRVSNANTLAVGTSHLIETLSLQLERMVRHLVLKKVSAKEANEIFTTLTTPLTTSFMTQKDELLWKIKNAKQKETPIKEFLEKFYWLKSSYAGNQLYTKQDVLDEAEHAHAPIEPDFKALEKKKNRIFQRLGFNAHEKNMIAWTDFTTQWQDDRKKNILRSLYCIHRVLREIVKRFNADETALTYLLPEEITLANLKNGEAEKTGRSRINGCVSIDAPDGQFVFAIDDFEKTQKQLHKHHGASEVLNGTCASLGTATGPVKVCTTIESIGKLKEGDILVASMTRPEFVSAMKKASAIVTDEGGITCHAAIVSRELGKPCVIGTKTATKVLKDGWIVQVKANHGQVIVLEKKP